MTTPLEPMCPKCRTHAVIPRETHWRGAEIDPRYRLVCAACGLFMEGTDEMVRRAQAAERRWRAKDEAQDRAWKAEEKRAELAVKLERAKRGEW